MGGGGLGCGGVPAGAGGGAALPGEGACARRGLTPLAISALVLAAGAGRRFGGGKLMAPFGGRPLIDGALEAALTGPFDNVRLVAGADPRVAPHAAAFARERGRSIGVVEAADHAEGLGASLRAGLLSLPPGAGAVVLLGDMPRVPHAILEPLARALRDGAPAAAPVFEGRRGHPVALGPALVARAAELRGDRGAAGWLQSLGDAVASVPTRDDGVLFDVDAPGDLAGG